VVPGTELRRIPAAAVAGVLATSALAGCAADDGGAGSDRPSRGAGLPQGSESVELDPADFTLDITNPYWPMDVGDRWVFEETEGGRGVQRVEVTVLAETYTVALGIEARVVHDLVTEDGATVEDTFDWYAQDSDGNVWYLGERTAEYENGQVVSTEGSWEAGVDGAQPGIAVPADPRPGLGYRQEYLRGEAEDEAIVLSASEQAQTPAGTYGDALLTRDTTPLQPEVAELKLYAPGVGPVLVLQTSGGAAREALVATTR
jgi:hypothetical protein